MLRYKEEFINDVWKYGILQFGSFELKSGRVSPYYFDITRFDNGDKLRALATAYAKTINHLQLEFDVLYGPAYTGIPLCASASLMVDKGKNKGSVGFAFNKKEDITNTSLFGHPLKKQRVLVLDAVITSGLTLNDAIGTVANHGGQVVGAMVIFDRQERSGTLGLSALQQAELQFNIPVYSIIALDDITELCPAEFRSALLDYRAQYSACPQY